MTAMHVETRGRPLLFLFALLGGWTFLRVATWESPWPAPIAPPWVAAASDDSASRVQARATAAPAPIDEKAEKFPVARSGAPAVAALAGIAETNAEAIGSVFTPGRTLAGHQLMLMSAMGRLPMPTSMAAMLHKDAVETGAPALVKRRADPGRRWRFDGWLLLRDAGGRPPPAGARPASYGASQIGGVLAFDLAPRSDRDPAAYLRLARALQDDGEGDAALGLRARPLARLPLALHAEMRATRGPGGSELRPAAFATISHEFRHLPVGLGARTYAQAGYVGGRNATTFVDGHLVVEREVARFDLGSIVAGAGAWGGAQQGAARVDVGPPAGLEVAIGNVPARLSLDYRIRVAGNAEPENGPAFTLSTGF